MEFRRIVIAIDGSPTSLAGLEAAAGLASAWHAEVTGLLVEDTNLLRMASLPFAREVGTHSGAYRVVSTDDFEHQFHSQADRARNTLWYTAERYRLTASFSVVRGTVRDELIKACKGGDLLCLGKGGQSVSASQGLGSNARALVSAGSGVALLFSHVANVTGPLAVFYDGSPTADRALEATMELATVLGTGPTVLLPGPAKKTPEELSENAARILPDLPKDTVFRRVHTKNGRDLARYARSTGANVVVVPSGGEILPDDTVQELVGFFFGPVMVVGRNVLDSVVREES